VLRYWTRIRLLHDATGHRYRKALTARFKGKLCAKFQSRLMLEQKQKHTTGGIPRWSPTLVLVARFSAYVWQSGRDAQFSLTYGRMCQDQLFATYKS
jgi:hypothetical protein